MSDLAREMAEYVREKYDRIELRIPKGNAQALKEYAAQRGLSVNSICVSAIEEKTGLDLTSKPGKKPI